MEGRHRGGSFGLRGNGGLLRPSQSLVQTLHFRVEPFDLALHAVGGHGELVIAVEQHFPQLIDVPLLRGELGAGHLFALSENGMPQGDQAFLDRFREGGFAFDLRKVPCVGLPPVEDRLQVRVGACLAVTLAVTLEPLAHRRVGDPLLAPQVVRGPSDPFFQFHDRRLTSATGILWGSL